MGFICFQHLPEARYLMLPFSGAGKRKTDLETMQYLEYNAFVMHQYIHNLLKAIVVFATLIPHRGETLKNLNANAAQRKTKLRLKRFLTTFNAGASAPLSTRPAGPFQPLSTRPKAVFNAGGAAPVSTSRAAALSTKGAQPPFQRAAQRRFQRGPQGRFNEGKARL